MKQYWVYILCSKRNGTLYVGVTNDLPRRIHEHKEHSTPGFTKKYNVTILAYFEEFYQWTRLFIEKSALKSGNMAPRLDPRLRALLSKTFFGHHELATFNPQILRSDFALTQIYERVNLSFPRRRESSREATFLDSRLRGNDKCERFWTVVRLRGDDNWH